MAEEGVFWREVIKCKYEFDLCVNFIDIKYLEWMVYGRILVV